MPHARKATIAIAVIITLGGCTITYRETLQEKLEGKNAAERRVILAQECSQEIQRGLKPEDESNVRHFEKMKVICEKMTGHKVPVDIPVGGKKKVDMKN